MGRGRLSGLLLAAALLLAGPAARGAPAVALHYGPAAPLAELRAFDIVVVEPDHGYDPLAYRGDGASELYAYVSVGEAHPSRPWFAALPESWQIAHNPVWGSRVIDQSQPRWPAFFAERVIAPLWARGYRGFFLDTLDAWQAAGARVDAGAQREGLVRVITLLRERYPGIRFILNRGFELLPRVREAVVAVAAESLHRGYDAASRGYRPVSEADRAWLAARLREVQAQGVPAIAIDYVAPAERALARDTARRIAADGFIPWVTDGLLATLGIGAWEVVPRRVLLLYDSRESPVVDFANGHRYLGMPLAHLGLIPEYVDVRGTLPEPEPGRYAGVVSWFSGGLEARHAAALAAWLARRRAEGLPLAVFDSFGFDPVGRGFGLDAADTLRGRLAIVARDPMMGLELAPLSAHGRWQPLRLAPGADARALLTLADAAGTRSDVAALTAWGGYVLGPYAVAQIPAAGEQTRWVVDPFLFLAAALRLPPVPVPDLTTGAGRRLLLAHMDGDGFPSRAEFPGSPLAPAVMLREILERYRIPTAVSVIEAEIAPHGLYPQLAPQLEHLARRMFALPHVEIATHSFSHPFRWSAATLPDEALGEGGYALAVPGYRIDLEREIAGSARYIAGRLAPPGKPVRLMLWTGDALPGAEALAVARRAGLLDMNGGATLITRARPSLTYVSGPGAPRGSDYQVYAPLMNENVYTDLWRGPFYGYRQVIDTFALTESPRRLKPINIYFHTYAAAKPAGLAALRAAYDWALARPVHPVFASEYVQMVHGFRSALVARATGAGPARFRVRGAAGLRTLRLPETLGAPVLATAAGIAGHTVAGDGRYLHLAGANAEFAVGDAGARQPLHLADANGHVSSFDRTNAGLRLRLEAHVPLEFTLASAADCRVSADGRSLAPLRRSDTQLTFRLHDAAATIEARCN